MNKYQKQLNKRVKQCANRSVRFGYPDIFEYVSYYKNRKFFFFF